MLMSIDEKRKKISDNLVAVESKLKVLTSIGRTDLAVELENFILPIMNIYLSKEFENMNNNSSNQKGIDLISKDNEIGIQVTINESRNKIKNTLEKTKELYLNGHIKKLYIFVLTNKNYRSLEEFNTEYFTKENLIIIKDIVKLSDNEKIEEIFNYIEGFMQNRFSATEIKYLNLIENYFIETQYYIDAKNLLNEKNTLILTGNAGIGKTFTSYKIYFELLHEGYIPIKKIQDIIKSEEKYVFFKDDFLKATTHGNIDFEEVKELFALIDNNISNKINMKIILNSRMNIYNDVKIDQLDIDFKKYDKYIHEIKNYLPDEKILILKKYLLPNYNKKQLLTLFDENFCGDKIDEIVNNINFNPRIIERFLNVENHNSNLAEDILNNLRNPKEIYAKQYKELSVLQQEILKIVWLNDGKIMLNDIEEKLCHKHDIDSESYGEEILKLENSFLLSKNLETEDLSVEVYNPSVLDFLDKRCKNDNSIKRLLVNIHNESELLKILNINGQLEEKKEIIVKTIKIIKNDTLNKLYKKYEFKEIKNKLIENLNATEEIKDGEIEILSYKEIHKIIHGKKWEILKFINEPDISLMSKSCLYNGDITIVQKLIKKLNLSFQGKVDDEIYYLEDEYKSYKNNKGDFPVLDIESIKEEYEEEIKKIYEDFFTRENRGLLEKTYVNYNYTVDTNDYLNFIEYKNKMKDILFEINTSENYEDIYLSNENCEMELKKFLIFLEEYIKLMEELDFDISNYDERYIEEILENLLEGDYTMEKKEEKKENNNYEKLKEKFKNDILAKS